MLTSEESNTLTQAIAAAEARTTGEIRVFITHRHTHNPLTDATHHFHHLKMHHTTHRNAVLIFVAPSAHTFAIYADTGLHHLVPDDTWTTLTAEMTPHFKAGNALAAITHAIQTVGALLTKHFPLPPGTKKSNALPNQPIQE